MEPRPPKTTRPVMGAGQPVFTPPPVPTAERLASRPAWLDEQPPAMPSPARDERGAIDPAASPTIGPSQARAVWYDPSGEVAPGMEQPAMPRSPLSPVVSPRGERRSRFLGPVLAALLLVLVVGGVAFAVDKAREGNDQRAGANATRTAEAAALGATPVATATTKPAATVTTAAEGAAAAPNATDTTEPTQERTPTEEATPTKRAATRTPTKASPLRAPDLLPDASDLPKGFVQTADDHYTKDEMISELGANGAELVDQWKWRENAYRYFDIPASADPDPKEASSVTVSVHRFATKSGAADALNGLADIVSGIGYDEVDVAKIGDGARALTSEQADGNFYVLYVRIDNFVIRFGGFSVSGDPSDVVIALAKKIANG